MPKYKHFCKEWDFLEIDEDSPEFEACICELDSDDNDREENTEWDNWKSIR